MGTPPARAPEREVWGAQPPGKKKKASLSTSPAHSLRYLLSPCILVIDDAYTLYHTIVRSPSILIRGALDQALIGSFHQALVGDSSNGGPINRMYAPRTLPRPVKILYLNYFAIPLGVPGPWRRDMLNSIVSDSNFGKRSAA